MPQSGERIRGRDNMRAFQEAYPDPPTIRPRRVVGAGRRVGDRGPQRLQRPDLPHGDDRGFRDGKIWRDTRYYAEPFEAPAWRAQWVEPMADAAEPGR
jgi:hypothetical protein